MEAAHIPWRPLGRLLVEQGLLTDQELEFALAKQQTTGRRLGETIVECGFVSSPELSNALAAQYGIELIPETGFGTGLRAQIQRRHENDRGRPMLASVPDPEDESVAAPALPEESVPELVEADAPPPGERIVLAQLEEQWAKLAAAEEWLAEREVELAVLAAERDRRRAQAERLVRRARSARLELVAERDRSEQLTSLTNAVDSEFSEQRAKLAAAEEQLLERERELELLNAERERRRAQAVRFVGRLRARDAETELRKDEQAQLVAAEEQLAERLREVETLTAERERRRAQAVRFVERVRARDTEIERRDDELRDLARSADGQIDEQRARLDDAEKTLAERERELVALTADRERRRAQAVRFVERVRARDAEIERRDEELKGLAQSADGQVDEQRAKLAAAEEILAERERELVELTADRDRRRAQAVGFVRRMRRRDEELARRTEEVHGLRQAADGLRDQAQRLVDDVRGCDAEIERLRHENTRRRAQAARFAVRSRELRDTGDEPVVVPPSSHLVFLQLATGYELVEREGPPPPRHSPLELPDVYDGTLVVAGSRRSPLPGDRRPCIVAELA